MYTCKIDVSSHASDIQRILHREGWTGDYAQLLRARRPRGQQQTQQQLLQQQRGREGGVGGVGVRRRIEALEVEGEGSALEASGTGRPRPWTAAWAAARAQGKHVLLCTCVGIIHAAARDDLNLTPLTPHTHHHPHPSQRPSEARRGPSPSSWRRTRGCCRRCSPNRGRRRSGRWHGCTSCSSSLTAGAFLVI